MPVALTQHAVIIAAGRGSRLRPHTNTLPKPLVPILGVPLIVRTMETARSVGIHEFTVITGYQSSLLQKELVKNAPKGLQLRTVYNPDWERPNGISVLAARSYVPVQFVLMMSDHLFDADVLRSLVATPLAPDTCRLAIDYRIDTIVDIDDATKVRVTDSLVTDIGKNLQPFDAVDTGAFFCSSALFDALDASVLEGDESLSGGVRLLAQKGRMETVDIGTAFWQDVDTEADLRAGEQRLRAHQNQDN